VPLEQSLERKAYSALGTDRAQFVPLAHNRKFQFGSGPTRLDVSAFSRFSRFALGYFRAQVFLSGRGDNLEKPHQTH
jgi:hypothetical protein